MHFTALSYNPTYEAGWPGTGGFKSCSTNHHHVLKSFCNGLLFPLHHHNTTGAESSVIQPLEKGCCEVQYIPVSNSNGLKDCLSLVRCDTISLVLRELLWIASRIFTYHLIGAFMETTTFSLPRAPF